MKFLKKIFSSSAKTPQELGEDLLFELRHFTRPGKDLELVRKGAALDIKDSLGYTALHYAIHRGRTELALAIIERKADIRAPSPEGESCLMMAVSGGRAEIVWMLLGAGADANEQGNLSGGPTVLMQAAGRDCGEILAALLNASADPNQLSVCGLFTPLIMAARGGCAENIRLLLERGADPDQQNIHRTTALSAISYVENGEPYSTVARLLKEAMSAKRKKEAWLAAGMPLTRDIPARLLRIKGRTP